MDKMADRPDVDILEPQLCLRVRLLLFVPGLLHMPGPPRVRCWSHLRCRPLVQRFSAQSWARWTITATAFCMSWIEIHSWREWKL